MSDNDAFNKRIDEFIRKFDEIKWENEVKEY